MTTPQMPPSPTLRLRVSHGDLRDAIYPVLVGHFSGEPLRRAERAADEALSGALSRRATVGDPPSSLGAHYFVPGEGQLPPGALVVDLGEALAMTRARLTEAVASAARGLLWDTLSREPDARVKGLSTIPLGAFGPRPLPVTDATWAIIDGVARALITVRRGLQAHPDSSGRELWLDELEVIALHEDQAIGAMDAVVSVVAAQPWLQEGLRVEVCPNIRRLGGRKAALPRAPYATGRWREVHVRAEGDSLIWEVSGDRARAEQAAATAVIGATRLLLPDLVQARVTDDATGLARAAWRILVPYEMRMMLEQGGDLSLVVDPSAASIPWEALHPLALADGAVAPAPGVVRRLATKLSVPVQEVAQGVDVLIIADPLVMGRQLPGASAEASQLQAALDAKGFRCSVVSPQASEYAETGARPDAQDIIVRWHLKDWRIVHYAGHGSMGPVRDASGQVSPRTSLTAAVEGPNGLPSAYRILSQHVAGMSPAPELVFLNCCSAGAMLPGVAGPGPDLAASIAEQLIALGVRLVVVAAWPIADAAARAFAASFYDELLAGKPFGEAVRVARQRCHQESQQLGVTTWAAYQCYGDPDHRLHGRSARTSRALGRGGGLYLPSQVLDLLHRREDEVRKRALAGDAALHGDLMRLEEHIPPALRQEGAVAEALGDLWQRCRWWSEAAAHYRAALAAPQSGTSLGVLKKLADTELCLSTDDALAHGSTTAGAEELISSAERRAELFVELTRSPAALTLRGAIRRRRAWLFAAEDDRRAFLVRSREDYVSAAAMNDDPYPALHAATLGLLLNDLPEVDAALEEVSRRIDQQVQEHPHFWVRAARARVQLLEGLAGRPAEAAIGRYASLLDAHPSLWEVGMLRDELWSLQVLAPEESRPILLAVEQALRSAVATKAPGATALFEIRRAQQQEMRSL
jgi:hypothetical protein